MENKKKPMSYVKRLRGFLRKPGNTKAKLAVEMGFSTSLTIDKWISRNKVPDEYKPRLNEMFSKDGV